MNTKHLLLGTIAGAVLIFLLDSLFYGMLMQGSFTMRPGCDRGVPDWPWLIVGTVVIAFVFTYLYMYSGRSAGTPAMQGARFGSAVGVLLGFGVGLTIYSVRDGYPINDFLIGGIYDTGKFVVVGVIVAYIAKGGTGGGGDITPSPPSPPAGTDGE